MSSPSPLCPPATEITLCLGNMPRSWAALPTSVVEVVQLHSSDLHVSCTFSKFLREFLVKTKPPVITVLCKRLFKLYEGFCRDQALAPNHEKNKDKWRTERISYILGHREGTCNHLLSKGECALVSISKVLSEHKEEHDGQYRGL